MSEEGKIILWEAISSVSFTLQPVKRVLEQGPAPFSSHQSREWEDLIDGLKQPDHPLCPSLGCHQGSLKAIPDEDQP